MIDMVLVRPSRARNVAAACRAMKNMGLSSLVLVSPPGDLAAPESRALAYGAWDVLDGARRAEDLRAAIGPAVFVVGATGKPHAETLSPRDLAATWRERAAGGRMAVVFGPEASGLREDELALCHALVTIPADPAHSSLNLAQAVLIVAYELFLVARQAEAPDFAPPSPDTATAEQAEAALAELRDALVAIGYLNPQNPEKVLAELRRLLSRAGLTAREATLLRGLARQIRWSASGR
jgi:TrmH family RNA methyltransferase